MESLGTWILMGNVFSHSLRCLGMAGSFQPRQHGSTDNVFQSVHYCSRDSNINYWMDFHEIQHWYPWSQETEFYWLVMTILFPSCNHKINILTDMSRQLLGGVTGNLVQTFSGWIVMTLVILWLLVELQHRASFFICPLLWFMRKYLN